MYHSNVIFTFKIFRKLGNLNTVNLISTLLMNDREVRDLYSKYYKAEAVPKSKILKFDELIAYLESERKDV